MITRFLEGPTSILLLSQVGKYQGAAITNPVTSITGDSGGAVGPDGLGNIDMLGNTDLDFVGTPASNSFQVTNLVKLSPYVVGTSATEYRFTSVQTAINQAVADGAGAASPAIVYVTPGVYSENVALEPYVSVEGVSGGNYTRNIQINGNMTGPIAAGFMTLSGISITSPNAVAGLTIGGAIGTTVEISECDIFADNADGIVFANAASEVFVDNCRFSATPTEKPFDLTGGTVRFTNCYFEDSTVPATQSAGIIFMRNCTSESFALDSSAGTLLCTGSTFNSGANSCINLSTGGAVAFVYNSTLTSNAASGNYVSGVGVFGYSGITPALGTANAVDPALVFVVGEPLVMGNISFDGGATQITTNGELIIGSTGAVPQIGTLTGGTGVTITNGAGSITIDGTGGGYEWNEETGVAVAMAVNNGYLLNNAALVTATLPAVASVGEVVRVAGKGAGGWLIAQNAGQTIHFGSTDTTTGVGGSLASTNQYDCVEMVCSTANTDWVVLSSIGNITIV